MNNDEQAKEFPDHKPLKQKHSKKVVPIQFNLSVIFIPTRALF